MDGGTIVNYLHMYLAFKTRQMYQEAVCPFGKT